MTARTVDKRESRLYVNLSAQVVSAYGHKTFMPVMALAKLPYKFPSSFQAAVVMIFGYEIGLTWPGHVINPVPVSCHQQR